MCIGGALSGYSWGCVLSTTRSDQYRCLNTSSGYHFLDFIGNCYNDFYFLSDFMSLNLSFAKSFLILFIFSKNQLFVSLIPCIFKVSISVIFAMIWDLLIFLLFLALNIMCVCVCLSVCLWACYGMPVSTCRGQKTTCDSWFSPLAMWASGI